MPEVEFRAELRWSSPVESGSEELPRTVHLGFAPLPGMSYSIQAVPQPPDAATFYRRRELPLRREDLKLRRAGLDPGRVNHWTRTTLSYDLTSKSFVVRRALHCESAEELDFLRDLLMLEYGF